MIKRVFGKIDGVEVIYDHYTGDWWNVPVPLNRDGEYIIEIIAEDEAGNQSFLTRLLYTVKGENICVHKLALHKYIFEKQENRILFEKQENKIFFEIIKPSCKEVQIK